MSVLSFNEESSLYNYQNMRSCHGMETSMISQGDLKPTDLKTFKNIWLLKTFGYNQVNIDHFLQFILEFSLERYRSHTFSRILLS
jgi:hypothetical protein